jgi:hypothetical protein
MISIKSPTAFSVHRYGWHYAMSFLKDFHSQNGILLDDFIEKTHSWNVDFSTPYKRPWVGFLHNPHNMPRWFDYQHSPQSILESARFQESLRFCRGLIVLSDYLADWLRQKVTVPVISLKHPTGPANLLWNYRKYKNKPKIVQLGYWLRKLSQIYLLKTDIDKYWLPSNQNYSKYLLDIETRVNNIEIKNKDSVIIPEHLSNLDYDEMLSGCVAVMNLYDSSANNALIECIIRNTPVIINRHPAAIEYLGNNYPLYCDFSEFSAEKLLCPAKILETNEYLAGLNKDYLKGSYFAKTFYENIRPIL